MHSTIHTYILEQFRLEQPCHETMWGAIRLNKAVAAAACNNSRLSVGACEGGHYSLKLRPNGVMSLKHMYLL